MLSLENFQHVVEHAPLVSIDLVVETNDGKVLLGKRNNKPAQNFWFVPGGRVYKGEALSDAFSRLLHDELGLSSDTLKTEFMGVYQHFYHDSFMSDDVSTHYIVLAYRLVLPDVPAVMPHDQHSAYMWCDKAHIVLNEQVHKHSKWYFMEHTRADNDFMGT